MQQLTDHLNRVDETNSIKFTHEEEAEGTIPFLDTLLVRKESGEVKLLIFPKNTHTDQYLNFFSHHPDVSDPYVTRQMRNTCDRGGK